MNSFEYPQMLLLLFLPFVTYFFLPKIKGLHGGALKVPFLNDLKFIKDKVSNIYIPKISSKILFSLKFLYLFTIWSLLVLAVSRPQYVGEPHRLKAENRNIMLVIDISRSMLEPDLLAGKGRTDRLTAVKYVVSQFINERKSDRIGLILFGSRAYLQAPLTFDRKSVQDILINADAGMAGNSTAIGDAIGLALKNLKDGKKNKVIILLTDGENNDGSLTMSQAINLAEKEGIKIYTIGVGAPQSFLGAFLTGGNNSLDEKSLKVLANKTKGNYFRADDLNSLAEVYNRIDKLEPQNSDDNIVQEKKDLFYIPLLLALILSSFLLFLPRRYLK